MSKAGKALKQVLETYGISQNQLAATMGIGRSSINRWVNEYRDPASEAVLKLRKGLQQINPQAAIDFISLYLDDVSKNRKTFDTGDRTNHRVLVAYSLKSHLAN